MVGVWLESLCLVVRFVVLDCFYVGWCLVIDLFVRVVVFSGVVWLFGLLTSGCLRF